MPFGFTLASLAVYVYWRGVPGSPMQLGTYVAMPLWGEVSFAGKFGLFCFFAALMSTVALWREGAYSPTFCLQRLLCVALIVVFFIPQGFVQTLSRGTIPLIIADFLLFWVKVSALCLLLPCVRCFRLPHNFLLCLLGAVSLFYEYTTGS